MNAPRGWGRHLATFAIVAAVTALPWIAATHLIWSR